MDPFVLLPAYRIVVCRICGFACVANEARAHLTGQHQDIQPNDRRSILEVIQNTRNILRNQSDINELIYPNPTDDPIPVLKALRQDGLRCIRCDVVYRHVQQIQEHCSKEHR